MASLQPFSLSSPSSPLLRRHHRLYSITTIPKATDSSSKSTPSSSSDSGDVAFESKLSEIRTRYGTRPKKSKPSRKSPESGSKTTGSVLLPPVSLKKPVSEGLKVEFGFSRYAERVNGRASMLGLTALLLVELATGKSVVNYHSPPIVFLQVYFVAAACAVAVKIEKEKISVWP
ncbi:hypothetical protein Droror1_Dr00016892 [Drosera rotundifolia]